MFCPNCGTQNNDGVKFCANCGAALTPDTPAAAPVQQYNPVNPVNTNPVNVTPVYSANTSAAQKTNVLCIVGFIVSLVSIVLLGTTAIIGLILSIIGLIAANKSNQKGKGMGIAGVIISGILVAVWIFAIIYGISDASSSKKKYTRNTERTRVTTTEYEETTRRRETERETTEAPEETEESTRATTRETEKETEPSESKKGLGLSSVGNAKTGTVKLTEGTWVTFHELGGFSKEVVEHEQAKDMKSGAIIGLFVLDVDYSAEDLAKSQMASMEKAGVTKPTGARVKLGGYDAIQCYGMYPDGVILVCWFFKGNDGQMRKVTVEFKEENYSIFSMVEKGYELN